MPSCYIQYILLYTVVVFVLLYPCLYDAFMIPYIMINRQLGFSVKNGYKWSKNWSIQLVSIPFPLDCYLPTQPNVLYDFMSHY